MSSDTSQERLHSLLAQANELIQEKRFSKARRVCEQALALAPESADAFMLLAWAHEGRGAAGDAIGAYRRALECDPKHLASWVNLGVCQKERGNLDAAVDAFARAVETDASSLQGRYNLAKALFDSSRIHEALIHFREVLRLRPGWTEVHYVTGLAYELAEEFARADASFGKVIELDRSNIDARLHLVHSSVCRGDLGRAGALLEELETLGPDDAGVLLARSRLERSDAREQADLRRIEALLDDAERGLEDKVRLRFAAFNMLHRQHQHGRAYQHLEAANALRSAERPFAESALSRDSLSKLAEEVLSAPKADSLAAPKATARASEKPLFIVGMPLTGAEIVDAVMRHHPKAVGMGQVSEMLRLRSSPAVALGEKAFELVDPSLLDDAGLEILARYYLDGLPAPAANAERVIDKNAYNLFLVPYIRRIFPNARFVLCRRAALDACWSCHTFAAAPGQFRFAGEIPALAWMHNTCEKLSEFLTAAAPGHTLNVEFESFLGDFEGAARRIVDFAGLAWDDACLAARNTLADGGGASVDPLVNAYRNGQWEPYEAWAGQMRRVLAEGS